MYLPLQPVGVADMTPDYGAVVLRSIPVSLTLFLLSIYLFAGWTFVHPVSRLVNEDMN